MEKCEDQLSPFENSDLGNDRESGECHYSPEAAEWLFKEKVEAYDLRDVYQTSRPAVVAKAQLASVTVVITCFLRPHVIARVIESYLNQHANIQSIIVYLSGSPVQDEYLEILRPIIKQHPEVGLVDSTINMGYFGKLQVAIQTFTDFVVFADDDIVQGERVIEALIAGHYGSYPGVLGVRGARYICSPQEMIGKRSPGTGELSDLELCSQASDSTHWVPKSGSEVDTLFSFWLLPSDWVRVLFMEQPVTYRTAEDMHISYMVRKYLGKATYLLQSQYSDYNGNLGMEIGGSNRSWVDSVDTDVERPYTLPELDKVLSGPVSSDVKKRDYNFERDMTMGLLAERGNQMYRNRLLRTERQYSALIILAHADVEQHVKTSALQTAMNDKSASVLVFCRSQECSEYKEPLSLLASTTKSEAARTLHDLLFGSYTNVLKAKLYRLRAGQVIGGLRLPMVYSSLLADVSTLLHTLQVTEISMCSPSESSEDTQTKVAAKVIDAVALLHGITISDGH